MKLINRKKRKRGGALVGKKRWFWKVARKRVLCEMQSSGQGVVVQNEGHPRGRGVPANFGSPGSGNPGAAAGIIPPKSLSVSSLEVPLPLPNKNQGHRQSHINQTQPQTQAPLTQTQVVQHNQGQVQAQGPLCYGLCTHCGSLIQVP